MKKLINTTLLLAYLAGTGFISSCSKSDSGGTVDNAARFAGTYLMSSPCFTAPRDVLITYNGTSSVSLPWATSEGTSCNKLYWIPANVSGNNILSTSTSFYDNCGTLINATVSGSLSGNTLTLIYTSVINGQTFTCTYTGPKK